MAFNDPICCKRMRSSPVRVAHVEGPGLPLCPTYSICDTPARTPLTHPLWLCIHFPISHPRSWSSLGQRMQSEIRVIYQPPPWAKGGATWGGKNSLMKGWACPISVWILWANLNRFRPEVKWVFCHLTPGPQVHSAGQAGLPPSVQGWKW